ncbi:uncharacterized protein [Apostichopus japonicus]|uniref:uncharacterized protein isoform X2 n=1 Tax=Stichopus japonicus TaxID=307972 RepID=UPI003AB724F8
MTNMIRTRKLQVNIKIAVTMSSLICHLFKSRNSFVPSDRFSASKEAYVATVLYGSLLFSSAEGTYLGCFDVKKTELSGMIEKVDRNNMTVSMCSDFCGNGAYDKYGLQYGYRCYCGNLTEIFKNNDRAEDQCKNPCPGSPKCGGNQVIAIYNYTSYVGCYSYTPNEIMDFGGKVEYLTPTICSEICHTYKFFGVTQGSKCYCRSVISNTRQRNDDECNELPCQGVPTCGGSGYIAIWDFVNRTQINASTTVPPTTDMSASITVLSTIVSLYSEVFLALSFALGCLVVIGVLGISRRFYGRKFLTMDRPTMSYNETGRTMALRDDSLLHQAPLDNFISDKRPPLKSEYSGVIYSMEKNQFPCVSNRNAFHTDNIEIYEEMKALKIRCMSS